MFKTRPKSVKSKEELLEAMKKADAHWNSIDVDSELGKQLVEEAKGAKGVVRFEKERMTAVRPALPNSFNEYRKRLNPEGGIIPTDTLRDHVRGYLMEVEQKVEDYLPESVNLDEAITELNELTPLEWSAKYALPLLLTSCTQHFAMVDMVEDPEFMQYLKRSWEEHKKSNPYLNRRKK